jgi:hypothetical protein
MKKAESEGALRQLVRTWLRHAGITGEAAGNASFYEFKRWLHAEGYAHYLNFRSVAGSDFDAESWFDQETGQTWRR